MWSLEVLGPVSLTDASGAPVASVLNQPSRLALLGYLTLSPGDYQRRESLIGVFWPEAPADVGRNRLRQAVHFIRQELSDLITTRGREEVGVDRARIRCDALEFEELVSNGAPERGFSLYRGPLMEGLVAGQGATFDHWLDDRRAHYEQLAVGAAWSLAEHLVSEGATMAAATWARHAASFPGATEATVRRAMRLLADVGDHAGALDVYETLCGKLGSLFADDPSPVTRALAEDIRSSGREAPLTDDDQVAIRLLVDSYSTDLLEGNFERAVSRYVEDVVFSPPMEPMVRGRTAVKEWIGSRPPLVDFRLDIDDLQGTQSQAWARGHLRITVEVEPGQTLTMNAKMHATYVRQSDGQWKGSQVMWNLPAPGPVV